MDPPAGDSSNWTEVIEDLLHQNDVDASIHLLESVVSHNLQTLDELSPSSSSPSSARNLSDLRISPDPSDLYSPRSCSLKADELRTRSILRERTQSSRSDALPVERNFDLEVEKKPVEESKSSAANDSDDEDWEAIVDREPPDIGITKSLIHKSGESKAPLETKPDILKRRGRGSFMYKKNGLYSDEEYVRQDSKGFVVKDDLVEEYTSETEVKPEARKFGTRHVIVLYDFSPRMQTSDLERYFVKCGNSGVAIRWVNDTCALAVFQTPASAKDAQNSINLPFMMRALEENDSLLKIISSKDLEPPIPRPKTSARTAHRIITQVMGLKPSPTFGSRELRKQEQARRERINARHIMRDDAWGPDDP